MRALVLLGLMVLALVAALAFWPQGSIEPAVDPAQGSRQLPRDPGPEHRGDGAPGSREVQPILPPAAKETSDPPPSRTGSLEVSVVHADGAPAVHAVVRILPPEETWSVLRLRTDADGRGRIELEPGRFVARTMSGTRKSCRIRAGETARIQLRLLPGLDFDVLVTDADDQPVPGAEVWLSERWLANTGHPVETTDHAGRVSLRDVPAESYVSARAEGYAPSAVFPTSPPPSDGPLRIALASGGGSAIGIVVDDRGAPVTGALVLVGEESTKWGARTQHGGFTREAAPKLVQTDARGRFVAKPIASGPQPIQIRKSGFAPIVDTIEARRGGGPLRRYVLAPGATVTGKVRRPSGMPVAFAFVATEQTPRFLTRRVQAGFLGTFELTDLSPGEVELVAFERDGKTKTKLTLVSGRTHEWNPVLDDSGAPEGEFRLRGKVVDHQNAPLKGWSVLVTATHPDGRALTTHSDEEGRFKLDVPFPIARVAVTEAQAFRELPAAVVENIRVEDGEVLIRVLPAETSKARIRGTVVDASGRPVAAKVQFWHVTRRLWRSYDADAETGAFEIRNVPPGKVSLKVTSDSHPWMQMPERMVTAGQVDDLGQIALRAGGTVAGTIRFPDGRSPTKAMLLVFGPDGNEAGAVSYADGKFVTGPLGEGTYRLRVQGDRITRRTLPVTVREGAVTTVALDVQRAALRVFRIRLPEGAPRPSFLNIQLRDEKQRLFWDIGTNPKGETIARVSAPPGRYRLRVQDKALRLRLDHAVEISGLEDAPIETVTLGR